MDETQFPLLPEDSSSELNLTTPEGDITIQGDAVGGHKIIQTIQHNYYGAPLQAQTGLNALRELTQHSDVVRAAIHRFRSEFRESSQQIEMLSDYKDIHDLLHQLQFECYETLLTASAHFPDPEDRSLETYKIRLENITDQLQEVSGKSTIARTDVVWIQRLISISEDLDRAIQESDRMLLELVLRRLRQILEIQPSQINAKLNSTARTLRLPVLVETLSQVREHIHSQQDLDLEKVQQFHAGVDALVSISQHLTTLVDSHEGWQAVETMLNRIESFILVDIQELEISWPDLIRMTESLCQGRSEKLILAFVKESASLEEAIQSRNPVRTRNSFLSYRARAGTLFYRTDTDLKRLCGNLREVGTPLSALLRMTQ